MSYIILPTLPCCGCVVPQGKPTVHHETCWTLRGAGPVVEES